MTIWVTSHTHFNSETSIPNENRPFHSVEEMNASLIERWNRAVKKQDSVIHLGKFATGKPDQVAPIIEQLNGKILLLSGHTSLSISDLLEMGFVGVAQEMTIIYRDYSFNLSSLANDKLLYDGDHYFFNVYGGEGNERRKNNRFNVSCKLWDYAPVTFEDLLMEKRKKR